MPTTSKDLPSTPGIVLVGARSHRQGTGPFIAAGLATAGARIKAIVGTSRTTVEQARTDLQQNWNIDSTGYTDLQQALDCEQPQAVAICSPWRFHAEQLQQVAEAGCHCLVEKPLAWPATAAEVEQLLQGFVQRGLLLQMVSQWPTTLDAFSALHDKPAGPVREFSMRLSPISLGPDMITDAAPHFISMLQALVGNGEFSACRLAGERKADSGQLRLDADYRHAAGLTRASLLLETCEQRPRPAWYQVDELRADRAVELPEYQQYLVSGERRVPLQDPMQQVAARFVQAQQEGSSTDLDYLRTAHRNLLQMAAAWD